MPIAKLEDKEIRRGSRKQPTRLTVGGGGDCIVSESNVDTFGKKFRKCQNQVVFKMCQGWKVCQTWKVSELESVRNVKCQN